MSRQRLGLFGTLAAMGAVGAAAGLAWRWAQRHRAMSAAPARELSRWEGEGGALAEGADSASANGASAGAMTSRGGVAESSNGASSDAWPFPHGTTRH
jgi:hypothetical protein